MTKGLGCLAVIVVALIVLGLATGREVEMPTPRSWTCLSSRSAGQRPFRAGRIEAKQEAR